VTLCVYALTGSASPVSGSGLAGERLHLVRESSISAVVGRLKVAPRPSAETLRGYDRTVRRLAEHVPALLPARFGTCFEDPEELRFVLRSRRAPVQRALAHVRNRVQMTVRIVSASDAVGTPQPTREKSRAERAGHPAGRGAAYLRDRAAAAARERQIAGFDPVRAAVARWVRDEKVERQGPIITVYHLVPRSAAGAYQRAVLHAAAASGLRVVVSGPWPAYAFADTL
jgi:hypothetical protein